MGTDEILGLSEDIDKYNDFSNRIIGSKLEVGGNVGLSSLTGDKQVLTNQVMNLEISDVDDIAEELVEESEEKEDTKEDKKEEKPKEEKEEKTEKKADKKEDKKESKKEEPESDPDIDAALDDMEVEEIDFDDDVL